VKELKVLEEGRVLYQKNCRPCHGTTAGGDGPMARGFRLKPINFRDPGTIATVVEGYLMWRIKEGGLGLPPEATPWDSAMPVWKDELSDEEIWKIILAGYDTAGMEPRKLEKLE
jgi:mono/diheme cytochrome c family protein